MNDMSRRSPFRGMDPWLESQWGDVHHGIVQYGRDLISDTLPADLFAAVEENEYILDRSTNMGLGHVRPDVGVFGGRGGAATAEASGTSTAVAEPVRIRIVNQPVVEGHIEIRRIGGDEPLVTVIEVFSPTNKLDRRGRRAYVEKRQAYYAAGANVVEIDLLRAGEPLIDLPLELVEARLHTPYKACVRRAPASETELEADCYPLPLRERLPRIRIPLRETDEDIVLDLQQPIELAYERGRYGMRIDYAKSPEPPLSPEDAAWAAEQVRRWRE
jgi:hypothetical protein